MPVFHMLEKFGILRRFANNDCRSPSTSNSSSSGRSNGTVISDTADDSAYSDNASIMSTESGGQYTVNKMGVREPIHTAKVGKTYGQIISSKRLYLKIFCGPEGRIVRTVLIDEYMNASNVIDVLTSSVVFAEQDLRSTHLLHWSLMEHLPDLCMQRYLEDHENIMDITMAWKIDSKNKILFLPRSDKYEFFRHPEAYFLSQNDFQESLWNDSDRQALLNDYFYHSECISVPNIKKNLWFKSMSKKKRWKKYLFRLEASGLVYSSKKSLTNQLVSLDSLYFHAGFATWKRKYRAPTLFCFALKRPDIQTKNSKEIFYFCAETAETFREWQTAIRIIQYSNKLLENYRSIDDTKVQAVAPVIESNIRNISDESQKIEKCYVGMKVNDDAVIVTTKQQSDTDDYEVSSSSGIMSRSDSVASTIFTGEDTASEADGGFEVDATECGTIKRKPNNTSWLDQYVDESMTIRRIRKHEFSKSPLDLPSPPPPETLLKSMVTSLQIGSDLSINSLPPPPPPPENELEEETSIIGVMEEACNKTSQHDKTQRKKKISFNEHVTSIDDNEFLILKSSENARNWVPSCTIRNSNPGKLFENESSPPREFLEDLHRVMQRKWSVAQMIYPLSSTTCYNEKNVSNWILQSLKHSHIRETDDMTQDLSHQPNSLFGSFHINKNISYANQLTTMKNKKMTPPPPPRRNITTQLTSKVNVIAK